MVLKVVVASLIILLILLLFISLLFLLIMHGQSFLLQGCLPPHLFKPQKFGDFSFDSILHRLFDRPGNLTAKAVH